LAAPAALVSAKNEGDQERQQLITPGLDHYSNPFGSFSGGPTASIFNNIHRCVV